MVGQICTYTNQYAEMHGHEKPSLYSTWFDLTADEFYRFVGLLMYMSIIQAPNLEIYWSTKSLYHGLWARAFMSKLRFKQIQSFLKISNPDTEREDDKLRKVRFVHDFLQRKCMKFWQPNEFVSVDERMVRNKGRYSFRQYIKDKPTKWGMKLWVVADSVTGYTYNFNVYTGKDASRSVFGLGYDVVMSLCKSLLHQGYKIFMDNFYTSLKLYIDLLKLKTMACGTILANRKGFPGELRDTKAFNKTANRGNMRWVRKGYLGIVQWKDNKIVNMITTIHKNLSAKGFCSRRTKVNDQFRPIHVSQPNVVADYNKYMGGVDRSDQMIGKYKVLRKTSKYWKTLFYHFLDIARVNSFIMFQEFRRKNSDISELHRPIKYGQLDFTVELIKQLGEIEDNDPVPLYEKSRDTQHQLVPAFTNIQRNCVRCYRLSKVQNRTKVKCEKCDKYFCFSQKRNCLADESESC